MKQFRLVDNTLGWLIFLVAAVVYCSTIEPTASFWDCPEFIATGYKMEIGHPPGAPFFMLTANLFSHFASSPSEVARMVNTMSALLSAITILFLFWTITHLARKLVVRTWGELTLPRLVAIEASGVVGALIYTFSDTFWYSAVEGEVYAYSSAFTAVVFWLILKWEDHADEPHSDRWLVLIFYMTGLSIGVHLLNLLCIPAIVLVFAYRRFPHIELRGSLIALAVSFVLVFAVLYGVVPGIITVGGWFELFFVNVLGMPFNTGAVVYIVVLVSVVIWGIYESYQAKSRLRENISLTLAFGLIGVPFVGYGWRAAITGAVVLVAVWLFLQYKRKEGGKQVYLVTSRIKNTFLLCMLMLMIGYSSYAIIVIRSSANPPMDQNSPEDIFTLGSYLSRDQYGDSPLLYGRAYTSQVALDVEGNMCKPRQTEGAPIYAQREKKSKDEKDSYFVVARKSKYVYAQNMLFPRMWDKPHTQDYEAWMGGVNGNEVAYDRCGEAMTVKVPSQLDNLRFFFSYQVNFMYWRYFMWNFAGRQNDIQGNGAPEKGNWITGIPFFDNWRLGDQSLLPDSFKANKGHNVFYCLPLLLGIIGLFWQAYNGKKGIRQFWVVFFLFFMTGLAIVIYLNQTPSQPRERDYAYAGSFYAFAIWCGLGVLAITELLRKLTKRESLALNAAVAVLTFLVPIQMASQTWDDHDRSGRYACRDFGQNYLMTLQDEGNPIIFTNGDNDTFPLWYNQDVEGVRTDARVCNLSYLQTDWYIDQMKRPAYTSPSLPITWPRLDYCTGTNEYVEVVPSIKQQVLDFYKQNPAAARAQFGDNPFEVSNIMKYWVRSGNADMHVIPTDTLYVTIDKEAVRRSGMMQATDTIPDRMVISLKGKDALYKGDLMMLEIIAHSNWTRPVYVSRTVGPENYMNLGDNFILEGLAARITPFLTNKPGVKNIDTERMYRNLMTRYHYGNIADKRVYLDETVRRLVLTHRQLFSILAIRLISEGKTDKALRVLQKQEKVLPASAVPMTIMEGPDLARAWALLGRKDKAKQVIKPMWAEAQQYVRYYLSLSQHDFLMMQSECMMQMSVLSEIARVAELADTKWAEQQNKKLDSLYNAYLRRGGSTNMQ